jgi:hypothetical protein
MGFMLLKLHSHLIYESLAGYGNMDEINHQIMKGSIVVHLPLQPVNEPHLIVSTVRGEKIKAFLDDTTVRDFPLSQYAKLAGFSRIDGFPMVMVANDYQYDQVTNEFLNAERSLVQSYTDLINK